MAILGLKLYLEHFIILTLFGLAMSMICVTAGGGRNGLYGAKLVEEGACRRTLQPCKITFVITTLHFRMSKHIN